MLISPELVRLNRELHERNERYGSGGQKYLPRIRAAMTRLNTTEVLDYGCGKRGLERALGFPIQNYDPALQGFDRKPKPSDIVVCTDVLEHVEPDSVDFVLDHLSYLTKKVGMFVISTTPARKTYADGRNAHLSIHPSIWWLEKLSSRFEVLSLEFGEGGFEVLVGRGRSKHKVACYELSLQPTTFDFAVFAVVAKTIGMEHVRLGFRGNLKQKDYSEKESWERLENIIYPVCEALGLEYSFGESLGVSIMHINSNAVGAYRDAGRLAKFVGTPKETGYVTVTIRESRKPGRNSNRPEWDKFIAWCPKPVKVIEDYAKQPISVKDRLDLYAGADMNMLVNNGPSALCYFSDYPFISMKNGLYSDEEAGNLKMHGMHIGFQYPHFHSKQRLVWEDDSFENIKKHYEELM